MSLVLIRYISTDRYACIDLGRANHISDWVDNPKHIRYENITIIKNRAKMTTINDWKSYFLKGHVEVLGELERVEDISELYPEYCI